ncbi:RNA-binding protein 7 isoform X2 [Gouania willdenowi]|uniref:RNA-binding protein 7 isoform X2 n=1 Tax=Gouania willdenowi TaxID=441366 RepID=UPI0010567684|nr:RNA-binding protein 7 isoform X2 [Gouania willdenowi]
MGIEQEANRTLFIRNLDSKVTEEILFELFLQAGPMVKTKIPKDTDGKQKTFGFAVYKHEESVPYAMELLNGTVLHGRSIHVQFRSGSSHGNGPGNSRNTKPENTPNTHGHRAPVQFTPPQQMQGSFLPHNIQQKQILQLQSINGIPGLQHSHFGHSSRSGSRHHDNGPYRQMNNSSRSSGRHGWESHHHQNDRGGYRHHDDRGGNRHYDDYGNKRSYQEKWRR